MIDGSISAITRGGIISLWLRWIILNFFRGHTDFQIDKHIHIHTLQKTFHDIIGFIRSRPKQESSPLAGLMSMLSAAEGEVVDQNSALLLSPHFSLCLWVGHITAE